MRARQDKARSIPKCLWCSNEVSLAAQEKGQLFCGACLKITEEYLK
jgi:hypothetical protein